LFCFPHAGGNASVFRDWAEEFPKEVEVCAIQLPGRGGRIFEPPAVSLVETIAALSEAFRPYQDRPFALFGHSLGALVGFEFARRLRAMNIRPVHLFVSGRGAPQLPDPEPPIRHLPAAEFVEAVRWRYQGIPDEILRDGEMMNLWLPALRADITIDETYRYREEASLDCPISCFGGLDDGGATVESLAGWRDQTSGAFAMTMLPGGHFFIQSARQAFLRAIAEELERSLCSASLR
jgi:medium-chain acyl-[acyl-carrier-protein] hydrolase